MFESLQDIVSICETEGKKFWYVVLQDDIQERHITEKESLDTMKLTWQAMLDAAKDYDASLRSNSGLVGGDGAKMEAYRINASTQSLCGDFVMSVITGALQMGESNACMKRIVAAPTAGACGVLPAVLVPYYNQNRCSLDDIIHALYVAAGIGQVIAYRASISGAAGGCQAEIGSASAMAAGALTFLQGGNASHHGRRSVCKEDGRRFRQPRDRRVQLRGQRGLPGQGRQDRPSRARRVPHRPRQRGAAEDRPRGQGPAAGTGHVRLHVRLRSHGRRSAHDPRQRPDRRRSLRR